MRQTDISTALTDRQQLRANRLSVSNPLRFGMDRAKARAATRRTVFRAVKDNYGSNKAISEALSEGLREEFSPSYVSQLLNGHRNIGDDVAEKIERALSLPSGYLDNEKNSNADISPCLDNVTQGPDIRGKVPVISWVQAGAFCEAIDNLHTGDAYEWIETSVQVREHTFALRVHGDSMEPTFPEGVIIVIEPELDPLPGDYVIAKNGDEEATFKQLVKDGADWYLKPLNPRYPIKPLVGSRIVGVVRSAEQRFR